MRRRRNRYRPDLEKRRMIIKYWIKASLGFILSLVVVVLYSAALAHSYFALIDAPWFRVNELTIIGLKHIKEDEILKTLMIPPDSSLLSLRSSQLAKRLESLPWIESSVVQLSLPNRIVVEISERDPLAVLHAEDFFLIDGEGKLVSRASSEQRQGFLLVEGFSGLNLREGSELPQETLKKLKSLLSALGQSRSWLPMNSILKCRWDAETGFTLYTTRNSVSIQLGWDNFNRKLDHLQRIQSVLEEQGLWNSVIGIDLDYEDRAFIEGLFPFSKGT